MRLSFSAPHISVTCKSRACRCVHTIISQSSLVPIAYYSRTPFATTAPHHSHLLPLGAPPPLLLSVVAAGASTTILSATMAHAAACLQASSAAHVAVSRAVSAPSSSSSDTSVFFSGLRLPALQCRSSSSRRAAFSQRSVATAALTEQASKVALTADLEGEPEPPMHLFKNKEPFIGTVKSVERIVGPNATGETCHIVIEHGGQMPYWEGQSYGIIPPGENPKKPGQPNTVRLYSIASTRYGDEFDGKTASLCVRRAVYWCPELQAEDPAKKGICSNFLCDCKPGDKVQITGPSGKVMLLPESDPNATHIMVATGTGIAPYRGFLRRMFMEDVPTFKFGGLAWLFLGVANSDSLLYHDEFTKYKEAFPENFRYDTALSREEKNSKGGKMYVQDKIEEYSEELFNLLDNGAHIYFCGLRGMMPGIQDTLKRVAEARGENWEEKLAKLKKNKQWHVEVY